MNAEIAMGTDDVLLSVVVPSYNHSQYLPALVADHKAQTRPAEELIIVDDGSTDDSRAVLDRLAAETPRLRVIAFDRNQGVNAAFTAGVAAARGRYIRPGSTNDPIAPEYFEIALSLLLKYPEAGLFFADPAIIEETTRAVRGLRLWLSSDPCYFSPDAFINVMEAKAFNIPGPTMIFRKDALLSVGSFRPELEWHADWFAKIVVALRYGACYAPAHVAYILTHEDGYAARNAGRYYGEKALLRRVLALMDSPDFADVAPRFAQAAILPEHRLRALIWMAQWPETRRRLSTRLVLRCVAEELWRQVRDVTPMAFRLYARRWLGRRQRRAELSSTPGAAIER